MSRHPNPLPQRRQLLLAASAMPWLAAMRAANAGPDAQAMLVQSDAIRNPNQPFRVTLTLTEFDKGDVPKARVDPVNLPLLIGGIGHPGIMAAGLGRGFSKDGQGRHVYDQPNSE